MERFAGGLNIQRPIIVGELNGDAIGRGDAMNIDYVTTDTALVVPLKALINSAIYEKSYMQNWENCWKISKEYKATAWPVTASAKAGKFVPMRQSAAELPGNRMKVQRAEIVTYGLSMVKSPRAPRWPMAI